MFGFKAAIHGRHLMLKDIELARAAAERANADYQRQSAMYQQANDADVIEGECVRVEEPKALPSPEQE